MPYREFTDAEGRTWEVWEVSPETIAGTAGIPGQATWSTCQRELEAGWLCFSGAREKRRLAPFPATWAHLPHSELVALCQQARVVPARGPRRATRRS